MDMMQQRYRANITATIVVLLLCFVITGMLFRFRPPFGDDVLSLYMYAPAAYAQPDYFSGLLLERIETLPQIVENVNYCYMNWSGRILAYALTPLPSVFGVQIIMVLSGLIFTALVVCTLAFAFSSFKKVFEYPILVLAIYFLLIYYSGSFYFSLMWIMTCQNVVTALLFLIYMYWLNKSEELNNYKVIFFIVFGFICGITHEMIGAVFALMLLAKGISVVFIQKRMGLSRYVLLNLGFGLGYCICFFAPGNFARLLTEHSAIKETYYVRLYYSLVKHIQAMFYLDKSIPALVFIWLLTISVSSACFIRMLKRKQFKNFILNNIELITGLIFSPFLWALGPYTPVYAMMGYSTLFFAFLIRCFVSAGFKPGIWRIVRKYYINIAVTAVGILIFISVNFNWWSAFISTTLERERLVEDAKNAGLEEVIVPAYPEITLTRVNFYGMNNLRAEYRSNYYKDYFGIIIVPDEEKVNFPGSPE